LSLKKLVEIKPICKPVVFYNDEWRNNINNYLEKPVMERESI